LALSSVFDEAKFRDWEVMSVLREICSSGGSKEVGNKKEKGVKDGK
jgi:hypothetical protein